MARFWVGGTGNWSDTAHWSASSGGAGGASAPSVTDDATFDGNSGAAGYTVTLDASSGDYFCRDLVFAAGPPSGTITFTGPSNINPAGSVTLLAGMVWTHTAQIRMQNGTTGVTKTLRTNGVTVASQLTFSSANTVFQLLDDLALSGSLLRILAGTVDPNAKTVTMSHIAAQIQPTVGLTLYNLVYAPAAVKTAILTIFAGTFTVTNRFTVTGASGVARPLVQSDTLGTQRTINAAAVTLTNCDFMDIAGAGAATWSGSYLGDCLGNSGITFDASRTLYWVGGAGNWTSSLHWSLASGGASGQPMPLPQDDVVFDASSGIVATNIIEGDFPRLCRNLDFRGTGSLAFSWRTGLGIGTAQGVSIYGSVWHQSKMTLSTNSTGWYYLCARSAVTWQTAGCVLQYSAMQINAVGGTVNMVDDWSGPGFRFFHAAGTLNTNGFNITGVYFGSNGNLPRTLNLGASTITMTAHQSSGSNPWAMSGANLAINAGTSTIILQNQTGIPSSFLGNGLHYSTVKMLNVVGGIPGFGVISVTGANTIDTLVADPGKVVAFQGNVINTVGAVQAGGLPPVASDYAFLGCDGAGGLATAAHLPAYQITGDVDVWVRLALCEYNNGLQRYIFLSRRTQPGVTTTSEYEFSEETTGVLVMGWFGPGGAFQSGSSTVTLLTALNALGIKTGQLIWLRGKRINDNGSGKYAVQFFVSTEVEPINWTQIGATVVGAAAAAVSATTNSLSYATSASGNSSGHRLLEARLFSGAQLVERLAVSDFASGRTITSGVTSNVWSLVDGHSFYARSNELVLLPTAAANATLTKTGAAVVVLPYTRPYRITGNPAATWSALYGGDGGLNVGWTFSSPKVASPGFTGAVSTPTPLTGAVLYPTALVGVVPQPAGLTGSA